MEKHSKRIGVFICKCGGNISDAIDVDQLKAYLDALDDVHFSMYNTFTCSVEGQKNIRNAIDEAELEGVIIGCCTPRQYEDMFRETAGEVGLNPYLLEVVNLREQCAYPHFHQPQQALDKAKSMMRAAVMKIKHHYALTAKKITISQKTAVIGGGIAGITSALKLADLNHKVYLIEREPYIGGKMAKLVKTFPTDDCAMCTLSPRLNDLYKHKNIEILAYSHITAVERVEQGYRLKVTKKPRYIDPEKCTGCGKCSEVCPSQTLNTYNEGLAGTRPAVYKDYASAIPNIYTIQRNGLPPCTAACPLGQHPQAYAALIKAGRYEQAAQVILRDNPLPSVCGRVCHHPCESNCTRAGFDDAVSVAALKRHVFDKTDAAFEKGVRLNGKKAAVIGAGPSGLACAVGLAANGCQVDVYEAQDHPGGALYYGIPDYRLPKEILQADIARIEKAGVRIHTGCKIGRDKTLDALCRDYQAVYIAAGLGKGRQLPLNKQGLAGVGNGYDLLADINTGRTDFPPRKIVIIGGGNAAIDVARALRRCGQTDIRILCIEDRADMPAIAEEIDSALAEGIAIINNVMPTAYSGRQGRICEVSATRVARYIFSNGKPDIDLDPEDVRTFVCDWVLETIGQSGDPDLLGATYADLFANGAIAATGKTRYTGRDNLFVGGDIAAGAGTVSGAIGDGKWAALEMTAFMESGRIPDGTSLTADFAEAVSKPRVLQNAEKRGLQTAPRQQPATSGRISFDEETGTLTDAQALAEAERCLACGGCAYCKACVGVCEAGAIDFSQQDETVELLVGGLILAVGWKSFDGTRLSHGMGRYPNVVSQMQIARMLDPLGPTAGKILRPDNGRPARRIVMIQCAGSRGDLQNRSGVNSHCSKVCCMAAIKHAGLIKKYVDADMDITICYIDIRAAGKGYEEYYARARKSGIRFVRGIPSNIEYNARTGMLQGFVNDMNSDMDLKIDCDMLVLSLATELSDNDALLNMLGVAKDEYGFIREYHPKIKPTTTFTNNIFVAGSCQGPKDISESIAQAESAALNLATYIKDGFIHANPVSSFVDPNLCRACGRCADNCEFNAIKLNPDKMCAEVEPALCAGCCKCSAVCPTGAAAVRLNEPVHLEAMIEFLKAS